MKKKEYEEPSIKVVKLEYTGYILAGSGGTDTPEPGVHTPPSYRQEYEGIDRAWDTYFDR